MNDDTLTSMHEPAGGSASLPPPAAENQLDFPASYSQERLWFVQQMAPDSAAYNLPAISHLRGPLNFAALERSLGEILDRHQVLLAAFKLVNGRLTQSVVSPAEFRIRLVDLLEPQSAGRDSEFQRLLDEEVHRPFDLSRPPLLRATLFQLAADHAVLAVVIHHIAADGWSLGIFSWELATLYEAFAVGKSSPLPPLAIQLGEYAAWERSPAAEELWRDQGAFWRAQLAGIKPTFQIPPDLARSARFTMRGATHRMELGRDLAARLKSLCRQERVTPFMLLLAAFQVLIFGTSRQNDVLVGTPVINRDREELERLIGCLVNLLVLRTGTAGDPTFLEFLGRVKETVLSATAHQEMPFERVLEELRLKRSLERNPLLQVLFTFQRGPIHLRLPGLDSQPVHIDTATAKFDLFTEWWEAGEKFCGRIEYNTDAFSAGHIAQLAMHYQVILEALAANPGRRLSQLTAAIPLVAQTADALKPPPSIPEPAGENGTGVLTAIETVVGRVWRQVLRVNQIDRHENFFELGGHSLLGMQALARIQAALKIQLPLESVFEAPTIAELARVIELALRRETGASPTEKADRLV